ncbi:hypothetical protein CUT44_22210 [Streptomyces carminius]|uniref:CopG family transcriptional regulator n=1 Tax=Streptomyces carminius TaxID=2665496 RepID=A0A2M8LUP5_9ACTN|nr:hypothetical protein [Streptomyces carminius]PJE95677.1 hypothetical protein CUT44_22210 [Streptomyces carminius]
MATDHATESTPPRETTVKKSITLRRSVVEEIEERAGARGFSNFIDAAAEHWLALLRAREIVEEHEHRVGPLPKEALEEARRAWRGE